MPNRILRDWTDSATVNALDAPAEVLFTRLIMKVDDFGRYPANPRLIRSLLFPLKDGIREADISRQLAACEKAGLIALYTVADKPFLQVRNFKQRTRQEVSKYPGPDDGQMTVTRPSPAHGDVFEDEDEDVEQHVDPPDFVTAWNCLGAPFPTIAAWTEKRKAALKSRWAEDFFRVNWLLAMERMKASAFCKGSSERGWVADADWFLRPDTVTKLVEGKYDGGGKKPHLTPEQKLQRAQQRDMQSWGDTSV